MGSTSIAEEKESSDDPATGSNKPVADTTPALKPQDADMGSNGSLTPSESGSQEEGFQNDASQNGSRAASIREHASDSDSDSNDDDDADDEQRFPFCYPVDPPAVEVFPLIQYPADARRSSPSDRNLDFNRMVQANFVPFSKGLKGEDYRKRTNYEHQQIMGYVRLKLFIFHN